MRGTGMITTRINITKGHIGLKERKKQQTLLQYFGFLASGTLHLRDLLMNTSHTNHEGGGICS